MRIPTSLTLMNATAIYKQEVLALSGTHQIVAVTGKTRRYMELAAQSALQSDFCHKHGAILVHGGAVINTSFNKTVYNSFANRFRRLQDGHGTRHAEIGVVLGLARSTTNNADIYVVRVNNQGNWRLSYPCPMCIDVAKFVGIKRIIYSVDDGHVGVCKL
jgi:tRNA(Arg) A34 adenosine deaminase TadA